MQFAVYFAVLIVSSILSALLAPKPPKPKPASLEDFDVPTADEDRDIPVVFGTVTVTGPNVVWYGNLSARAIKKKVGGFFGIGKKKATINFRYFMGLHFAICYGPVDVFRRILVGERQAFAFPITESGTISIAAGTLFGGDEKEGGIVGDADVLMGEPTQPQNAYLQSQLGADIPAFRSVLSLVFKDGQVTVGSPYVKPFAFEIERILEGWDGGTAWYPEKAPIFIGSSAVSAQLQGLQFLFPCGADVGPNVCAVPSSSNSETTLEAPDGETYEVVLRVRGVVECGQFTGGTHLGGTIYQGGTLSGGQVAVNIYRVEVSSPASVHYINYQPGLATTAEEITFVVVDDEITLQIDAGATITLFATSQDDIGLKNSGMVSAPDDDPARPILVEQPYNGQFAQLDALSAVTEMDRFAMNPAHIIYQCLTDPNWGMGYPTAQIDDANFTAVADVLFAEGFGLCMQWTASEQIGVFVQQVLDHIGAILYADTTTGKFAIKLIRADYDPDDLETFDESDIVAVESFQRVGYGETTNEMTVVYRDVVTNKDTPITVQDLANIQAQGAVVAQTRQYPGIPLADVAARVAQRDLIANSTPLAKGTIRVTRAAWSKIPGDVIKVSWPKLGLSSVVFRVMAVNTGTLTEGTISVQIAEDVFGLPVSSYAQQQESGFVEPDVAIQPIAISDLLETTYWEVATTGSPADLAAFDPATGLVQTLAARPGIAAGPYTVYARTGSDSYAEQGTGDYAPTAIISGALVRELESTITLTSAVDLDTVEVGALALIGSGQSAEWVQVLTLTPTVTIARGLLDTTPQAFAGGARIWFTDDAMGIDSTARANGVEVDVKLSEDGDLDAAVEDSITINRRFARPYAPGQFEINGEAYPESVTDAPLVTWAHRDRTLQVTSLVLQSAADIGPEAGTTYNGYVYDNDTSTLLDSELAIEGTSWMPSIADTGTIRVEIEAIRGGLASWQRQQAIFSFVAGARLTEIGEVRLTEGGAVRQREDLASASGLELSPPVRSLRQIGTLWAGVFENLSSASIRIFAAGTGTYLRGLYIAQKARQFINVGTQLYICARNGSGASYLYRVDAESTPLTIAATHAASLASDASAVAYDGTDIWFGEFFSGNIKQLDATTLSAISTTSFDGVPTSFDYDDGDLWIADSTDPASRVVQWSTTTKSEVSSFSVSRLPQHILKIGDRVFVLCIDAMQTYDLSGTLIDEMTDGYDLASTTYGYLTDDGLDYVWAVARVDDRLDLFDRATGLFVKSVTVTNAETMQGVAGDEIFVGTATGNVNTIKTIRYDRAALAAS